VFVVFVNAGAHLDEAGVLCDTDGCGVVWNDFRQNFRRSRLKSKSGQEPERCTGCALTSSARCDAIADCDAVETERRLEAARTYDAALLSARAQAQSAEHRAAQADALLRPSASLSSNASLTQVDVPRAGSGDNNSLGATLSGKYPLFNKSTAPTIEQSRKAVQLAQVDLEAVEQSF
jgi:hypothetical protein